MYDTFFPRPLFSSFTLSPVTIGFYAASSAPALSFSRYTPPLCTRRPAYTVSNFGSKDLQATLLQGIAIHNFILHPLHSRQFLVGLSLRPSLGIARINMHKMLMGKEYAREKERKRCVLFDILYCRIFIGDTPVSRGFPCKKFQVMGLKCLK